MKPKDVLHAAFGYLKKNPDEVTHALLLAASLRFVVPLDALRYFAGQMKPGKRMPKDVSIGAAPPALRLGATVDAMGTTLRAEASLKIEEISFSPESVRIAVRLRDVALHVVGESDSPVATLVKSGALDLSKPGNLIKFIPKRPPLILEAEDDRIVVDLMKVPQIAKNPRVLKVLQVASPLVGIRAVETEGDHLVVALKATPRGFKKAWEAAFPRVGSPS